MSCCPPGSLPYLKADYVADGASKIFEDVEFYEVGTAAGKKGLLLVPDVWGWNGGRVRAIADSLASELACVVIIPKVQPPLGGGTDGDGLPPDYDPSATFPEFKAHLQSIGGWDEHFKSKMASLLKYQEQQGVTKVVMMGFCWGAWLCAATVKAFSGKINAIACAHPSIGLEEMIYGGDTESLCKEVSCPALMIPASNDGDEYRKEGAMIKALQEGNALSTTSFEDFSNEKIKHGSTCRGDLSDPVVKEAIEKAIAQMKDFVEPYLR